MALDDGGWPEAALHTYPRAIALNSSVAQVYFHQGIALWRLKRCVEAFAAYFDRTIALQPKQVEDGCPYKGMALAALGRTETAIATLEKVSAFAPNYPQAQETCDRLRDHQIAQEERSPSVPHRPTIRIIFHCARNP